MGLLDSLFGKNKKEDIVSQTDVVQTGFEDWSAKRSREKLLAEMKEMLESNFQDYEIVFEYPASMLDSTSHPACTPVQFMFQKEEKNVLAVVVVKQNTYRGMNVVGTKNLCNERGIPYIRFFEEYPNKEEYVIPRIREYL